MARAQVFINYRRDDSIGTAGRLHDRLVNALGKTSVFMDTEHIPAGADFVEHLKKQVRASKVFLVLIGPDWLNASNSAGERRLDDPDDFVVSEIVEALDRDIVVIPVLVDGAVMPRPEQLPDQIRRLVRRNAIEIRNANFTRDCDALIEQVRTATRGTPDGHWAHRGSRRLLMAAALLAAVAGAIALWPMLADDGAEKKDWAKAVEGNLIADWRRYLARWPAGAHAADMRAKITERQTNRQYATLIGNIKGVTSVSYTPDGKGIVTNSTFEDYYNQFRMYAFASGEAIRSYGTAPGIRGAVFTPDGSNIVAFGQSPVLRWWRTDDPSQTWDHHNAPGIEWIHNLSMSPDGRIYALACSDGTVRLRSVAEDREIAVLKSDQGMTWNVVFSPDGRLIMSGGTDGTPKIWDVETRRLVSALPRQRGVANPLLFSPDGRTVYVSGWEEGVVRAYDVATSRQLRDYNSRDGIVSGILLTPRGRFLAIASRSGVVSFIDLVTNSEVAKLRGHTAEIWGFSIAPDGRTMVSGAKDERVRIWDISDLAEQEVQTER